MKLEFNSKVIVNLSIKARRRELIANWLCAHEYNLDTTFWAARIMELNDAAADFERFTPWHSVGEYKAAA